MLTCVVGKVLGESAADDHWALRRAAAALIARICDTFGAHSAAGSAMQQRILKTMVAALLVPLPWGVPVRAGAAA